MIPFDFQYYKPDTPGEAAELFFELSAQGKNPLYYGGGTEIISFARLYQLYPRAVIDIKGIPECRTLESSGDKQVIGAAVTLGQIQEAGVFPLLSWCGGRVADRTIRNKITLGGNICARIPYREAVLALLAADGELVIQGRQGRRRVNINQAFNRVLQLEKGEFLAQVLIDREITGQPFISYKKTADGDVGYPQDRIGYPLVVAAGLKKDNRLRVAVSGLCGFPFRSAEVEDTLNDATLNREERINRALKSLPSGTVDDMEGSARYREFIFKNMLEDMMERLE